MRLNHKFEKLSELGAGDFAHLDGTLIDHLTGTADLLKLWSASGTLQDAGLFHAAYGTAGFDTKMVSINQRENISEIIGNEAEDIVYTYCACDRAYFWPQFGNNEVLEFRDRFNGDTYVLSCSLLKAFCELTVANELEIAKNNPKFLRESGPGLLCLFDNMSRYLSSAARQQIRDTLG